MNRLFSALGCLVLLGVGVAGPAFADSAGKGCQFPGSWFGFNDAGKVYFTSMALGSSNSSGTYILDVIVEPAMLSYLIPGATEYTEFRGSWDRLDGNSFAVSVIAIVMDDSRQVMAVAKLRGVDTLDETCNTMTITNWLDVYAADANPFTDDYLFSVPMDVHNGHRMSIP